MKGQTVIVTGGSSGIGKGIAARLCRDGAHVVIIGRNEEKLNRAKEEIETFDGQVLTIPMDIRHPDQVAEMVRKTKERFGRIHHLINNAAGNFIVHAEDLSINGWNAVINIVLNGTWYCSQAVAKDWIASGEKGSIVNIVATYAWTGCAGVVHSAAAKAGVLAMSQTLAVEWGKKYGIRVNCVAPGPIENTGGAEKLILSDEMKKQLLDHIPLGRLGRVEEVADVVAFLLSDRAEYINGECITVDAGLWLAGRRMI